MKIGNLEVPDAILNLYREGGVLAGGRGGPSPSATKLPTAVSGVPVDPRPQVRDLSHSQSVLGRRQDHPA